MRASSSMGPALVWPRCAGSSNGTVAVCGAKGWWTAARRSTSRCRGAQKGGMENRHILLVEDDPDDAELIINGLRRSNVGNDIDVVRDGVEALDYLYRRGAFSDRSTADPLLILLDLKMPRVDGRQVLQQIKSDAALKHLPVVVLTSSAHERDVASGYDLGANAYVVKPVHFRDLIDAVAQIGLFWMVVNRTPRK